jgi:hypothetical protein
MKIFVKSLEGKTVRIPLQNRMVTSEGMELRSSPYVLRRIADGDLIRSKKPKPKKSTKSTETVEESTSDKGEQNDP